MYKDSNELTGGHGDNVGYKVNARVELFPRAIEPGLEFVDLVMILC